MTWHSANELTPIGINEPLSNYASRQKPSDRR